MAESKLARTPRSTHPAWAVPFRCVRNDQRSGAARVWVEGEIDLATSPALAAALHSPLRPPLVILDLRQVTFMDCSGLHVIVDAAAAALAGGDRLVVVPGPPQVDMLFDLTGTTRPL